MSNDLSKPRRFRKPGLGVISFGPELMSVLLTAAKPPGITLDFPSFELAIRSGYEKSSHKKNHAKREADREN